MALKFLLKSGEYKTETREWSKLLDNQQTRTAWKTTFREAYVANQRDQAAREGEAKLLGGTAADAEHDKMRQQAGTSSSVPAPLPNQMLDSIEGYLDNIAAAATQAVANGGPLAELSARLSISVETMAEQA